jgi:hypothetical protein
MMNIGNLILYVAFPAIFLIVASANPKNLVMKGVCIALAYFSILYLDDSMSLGTMAGMADGAGMAGKSTSPFGIAVLFISLWAFVLVGSSAEKREEKDSDR